MSAYKIEGTLDPSAMTNRVAHAIGKRGIDHLKSLFEPKINTGRGVDIKNVTSRVLNSYFPLIQKYLLEFGPSMLGTISAHLVETPYHPLGFSLMFHDPESVLGVTVSRATTWDFHHNDLKFMDRAHNREMAGLSQLRFLAALAMVNGCADVALQEQYRCQERQYVANARARLARGDSLIP